MYVFYDNTGKIVGGCSAHSPDVVLTLIPSGTTELYLDDTQYSDVWNNMGEYTIQNNIPVSTPIDPTVKLANAQSSKISQFSQSRDAEIFSTYQSSALGTAHTYTADDRARMRYDVILNRMLRDSTYASETIYTHEAGFVAHNLTQVTQLVNDGMQHEKDLWTKYINLTGQINTATTVDAVNAINW